MLKICIFFLLWFTSEKLKDFGFRFDVRFFFRIHIFGLSAVRPFRSHEIEVQFSIGSGCFLPDYVVEEW